MRNDINDLRKLVSEMQQNKEHEYASLYNKPYSKMDVLAPPPHKTYESVPAKDHVEIEDTEEIQDESLSISEKEAELIRKALEKHDGRRRNAAHELGISERTLYRKIKEYNLE